MLAFKSSNLINISNFCQNFYMSRFDIKQNQNLELIYYNSKLRTQI